MEENEHRSNDARIHEHERTEQHVPPQQPLPSYYAKGGDIHIYMNGPFGDRNCATPYTPTASNEYLPPSPSPSPYAPSTTPHAAPLPSEEQMPSRTARTPASAVDDAPPSSTQTPPSRGYVPWIVGIILFVFIIGGGTLALVLSRYARRTVSPLSYERGRASGADVVDPVYHPQGVRRGRGIAKTRTTWKDARTLLRLLYAQRDTIIANILHAYTPGYKRASVTIERGRANSTRSSYDVKQTVFAHTVGALRKTVSPLDIAITARKGFFQVQTKERIVYSRNGHLFVDRERRLANSAGYLSPPIFVPRGVVVKVRHDGRVEAYRKQGESALIVLGRIELYDFSSSAVRHDATGNLRAEDKNVTHVSSIENVFIAEHLEESNVDIKKELRLLSENIAWRMRVVTDRNEMKRLRQERVLVDAYQALLAQAKGHERDLREEELRTRLQSVLAMIASF